MILCIDTSTTVCSAALCRDGRAEAHLELFECNAHASSLTPLIERLFAVQGIDPLRDIDAVAVSCGPGSYTGLRIGVSTAKGLCYSLSRPLIAISTLKVLAAAVAEVCADAQTIVPMIDARRMEVYTAIYDSQLRELSPARALVVEPDSFAELAAAPGLCFAGSGAGKCSSVLDMPNARFLPDVHPLAASMAGLACAAFEARDFVDTAYFEPFYLKDFVATKPKNKVF